MFLLICQLEAESLSVMLSCRGEFDLLRNQKGSISPPLKALMKDQVLACIACERSYPEIAHTSAVILRFMNVY